MDIFLNYFVGTAQSEDDPKNHHLVKNRKMTITPPGTDHPQTQNVNTEESASNHRDTKTQRNRDTETQRHRDTETQRLEAGGEPSTWLPPGKLVEQ